MRAPLTTLMHIYIYIYSPEYKKVRTNKNMYIYQELNHTVQYNIKK